MLWWLSIIQFYSKEELIVNKLICLEWTIWVEDKRHTGLILMKLVGIHFSPEFNDMSECDDFFGISDKEGFSDK